MATWDTIDRYVVISTDTHAGADINDYRPYLPAGLHDEFDAWAKTYVSPFDDLIIATASRNWTAIFGLPTWTPTGWPPRCCCPTPFRRFSDHAQHHHQPAAHPRRVRKALGRSAGP